MRVVKVSAPGKIILSGEHAVVYGYPAILAAVDRRLFVEVKKSKAGFEIIPQEGGTLGRYALEKIKGNLKVKDLRGLKIKIDSQIPIGCGMGSSAAFAVAITAAIFEFLRKPWKPEKINEIAYEIEKKQHGNPSGGDNTISTYGGFLWYRKESEGLKIFRPLEVKELPDFFLINTGKPKENTGEMVTMVKNLYLKFPTRIEELFRKMETVTKEFLRFLLKEESSDLKELIMANEKLLESLGVVSLKTRQLIQKIEKIGGAAKISGAGGVKKGSGIILAYHKDPQFLLNFTQKENLDIFKVKLGVEGVRKENE